MGILFKGLAIPQVSDAGGQTFFSQHGKSIQLTNKMHGLKLPL